MHPDPQCEVLTRMRVRSAQLTAAGDEVGASALEGALGLAWYAAGHEGHISDGRALQLAIGRAQRLEDEADLYANAGDLPREAVALHRAATLRDFVDRAAPGS